MLRVRAMPRRLRSAVAASGPTAGREPVQRPQRAPARGTGAAQWVHSCSALGGAVGAAGAGILRSRRVRRNASGAWMRSGRPLSRASRSRSVLRSQSSHRVTSGASARASGRPIRSRASRDVRPHSSLAAAAAASASTGAATGAAGTGGTGGWALRTTLVRTAAAAAGREGFSPFFSPEGEVPSTRVAGPPSAGFRPSAALAASRAASREAARAASASAQAAATSSGSVTGTLVSSVRVLHVPFVGCWLRWTCRYPSPRSCVRAPETAVRPSGIRAPMVSSVSRLPSGSDSPQSSSVFAVPFSRPCRMISCDALK